MTASSRKGIGSLLSIVCCFLSISDVASYVVQQQRTVQASEDPWESGSDDSASWSNEERSLREIPQYVWNHAPYVHLFSDESFWPCNAAEHLKHISPHRNYTKLLNVKQDQNLTNLHELNEIDNTEHGQFVWLAADDDVEERPPWLLGEDGIPESSVQSGSAYQSARWPNSAQLTGQDALHWHDEGAQFDDDAEFELIPSTNGRCGGNSGFTCKGSRYGQCCSIQGWCGKGGEHCGEPCNPLAGICRASSELKSKAHNDLRRRYVSAESERHKTTPAGRSTAPAILLVVPKGDGIVDAFWFFFYSFNQGQTVFGVRFGNHVADWEHTLIRFKDGKPQDVFLSEHNFGDAYAWHALEKYLPNPDGSGTMIGSWSNRTAARKATRPVVYSAAGSHAMYATPGLHPYILPWGLLHDETDRGPLWDPTLNVNAFTYDLDTDHLRAATHNPKAPTNWFHFNGHWGDKRWPLSDSRQYQVAGQYHYVNGPTGPKSKFLDRKHVCQRKGKCHIRDWVSQNTKAKHWPLYDDDDDESNKDDL